MHFVFYVNHYCDLCGKTKKIMLINLLSDTATKPTAAMQRAMWLAEVGDDVFREDPTVNALEAKCAAMFGHEAALFCPSGTMTNQIALKVHTRPLDEVICDEMSHIYQYEVGGYAFHSGIAVNLLKGENGILTADLVEAAIKPRYDWLPKSSLVVIENTCNKGGGGIYPIENIRAIRQCAKNANSRCTWMVRACSTPWWKREIHR